MAKQILVLLLLALALFAGYIYLFCDVTVHRGDDGAVQAVTIARRGGGSFPVFPARSPTQIARPAIRIATFNLDHLDDKKLRSPQVANVLARLFPMFDLVAVQNVEGNHQGILLGLVEQINASGRQFDFAAPPALDQAGPQGCSAFLFDQATIEIDRSTLGSVEDPQRRFQHKPLVALFRVKGPPQAEAFTFKLVNVHVQPDQAAVELDLLDDVYKAVRDAAGGEDDIILLGDFGVAGDHLSRLSQIPDITAAITDTPTTIRGGRPVDNIFFDRRATREFTGRADVLDLIRHFDLPLQEARTVSEHLPVWAEFSSYEGGLPGNIPSPTAQTPQ
jgi:deoxyribonuclease-1-like protein